jgi:hypothetical protein
MELYILDAQFRRIRVVDQFVSLIWAERFKDLGDFELVVQATRANRAIFKTGLKLAMNESYRVMIVETVEKKVDAELKAVLSIKGNSLEGCLEDRIARASNAGLATAPTWNFTLPPADAARKIFHDVCVTGVLSTSDIIPYIVEGTIMPTNNIPEPVDPQPYALVPQTVLKAIKDICDIWNLGFRILRNFDTSQLYWDVYSGSDRTSGQTTRPPVIFSQELDNLQNTSELDTIETSKNVAYVVAQNGSLYVFPDGVPPDTDGFDRRVIFVDANDITLPSGAAGSPAQIALESALTQRGKDELAKNTAYSAFDGEINQNSQYRYQRDYYLGDLVEVRNAEGESNQMRVTEQIFVSDQEGDRAYPTLTLNQFINTGSWLSWESNQQWIDFTTEYWADLP